MVSIPNLGIHFSSPREFPRAIVASTKLKSFSDTGVSVDSSSAAFFTECALRGTSDDNNRTANTYQTLLTVASGAGFVDGAIGPAGLIGTPTTTFEFTVDGAPAVEVAVVATSTGQRAFLGAAMGPSNLATTTGLYEAYRGPSALSADKTTGLVGTSNAIFIQSKQAMSVSPVPCLKYSTSLLVRVKSSENNSGTANQERQCAVLHRAI